MACRRREGVKVIKLPTTTVVLVRETISTSLPPIRIVLPTQLSFVSKIALEDVILTVDPEVAAGFNVTPLSAYL